MKRTHACSARRCTCESASSCEELNRERSARDKERRLAHPAACRPSHRRGQPAPLCLIDASAPIHRPSSSGARSCGVSRTTRREAARGAFAGAELRRAAASLLLQWWRVWNWAITMTFRRVRATSRRIENTLTHVRARTHERARAHKRTRARTHAPRTPEKPPHQPYGTRRTLKL